MFVEIRRQSSPVRIVIDLRSAPPRRFNADYDLAVRIAYIRRVVCRQPFADPHDSRPYAILPAYAVPHPESPKKT